jgi:hypothetical protein
MPDTETREPYRPAVGSWVEYDGPIYDRTLAKILAYDEDRDTVVYVVPAHPAHGEFVGSFRTIEQFLDDHPIVADAEVVAAYRATIEAALAADEEDV